MFLLSQILKRLIKTGSLTVIDATGKRHFYSGDDEGPVATMRLHDKKVARKLALYPKLYLGESYMDGSMTLEEGDIYTLLDLFTRNLGWGKRHPLVSTGDFIYRLAWLIRRYNPKRKSLHNVAHHYDLSDEFYDLFLDDERQYSCAYFRSSEDSLEQAQQQKMAHIMAKLDLHPDQKVLDIGCGWGGLARFLAKQAEVAVTGVTLSKNQLAYAQQVAKDLQLTSKVDYRLVDYRDVEEKFDRIVSVGMFEHVGVPHYDAYFKKVKSALHDDGVALIHTIGTADRPSATNPWIQKYIFPGGYIPPLSEIMPSIERAGLYVTDIEVLRLHYAETLRAWRLRFHDKIETVREIYDDRFCRMWDFYLCASETSFRNSGLVVFQIQLSKSLEELPVTRDYISENERDTLMASQIAAE
ncbi:MAG: cyclopropane-fatty-acyl-phospholipid synthase family protein [Proteobacteria bacterium]|nr:cyclopropane-fatty-acyl-phospholipid synthase family protein [Pseudomonadota bacterium]